MPRLSRSRDHVHFAPPQQELAVPPALHLRSYVTVAFKSEMLRGLKMGIKVEKWKSGKMENIWEKFAEIRKKNHNSESSYINTARNVAGSIMDGVNGRGNSRRGNSTCPKPLAPYPRN